MSDCRFDAAALLAEARAIRGEPPETFTSDATRRIWYAEERLQAAYLFARRCRGRYARMLEIFAELELIHERALAEQDGLQQRAGTSGANDPGEPAAVCRIR